VQNRVQKLPISLNVQFRPSAPKTLTIGLQRVWFHQLQVQVEKAGRPAPAQIRDVSRELAREAKQQVAALVQTGLKGLQLYIREVAGRKQLIHQRANSSAM
jgi:hypothetical protein